MLSVPALLQGVIKATAPKSESPTDLPQEGKSSAGLHQVQGGAVRAAVCLPDPPQACKQWLTVKRAGAFRSLQLSLSKNYCSKCMQI